MIEKLVYLTLEAGNRLPRLQGSLLFAVSIGFSLVIMQDAAGLRRAAGKTAATLNRLVDE
ncbi:MAG: divergent PAP2 family protein, partial [Lentisphaeria bacterium]|nr:divergent PAP2 family protein [Lentisphaeria bacterium]